MRLRHGLRVLMPVILISSNSLVMMMPMLIVSMMSMVVHIVVMVLMMVVTMFVHHPPHFSDLGSHAGDVAAGINEQPQHQQHHNPSHFLPPTSLLAHKLHVMRVLLPS